MPLRDAARAPSRGTTYFADVVRGMYELPDGTTAVAFERSGRTYTIAAGARDLVATAMGSLAHRRRLHVTVAEPGADGGPPWIVAVDPEPGGP